MTDTFGTLELTEDKRLSVISRAGGLAALPMVRGRDGQWRRAQPGDGVADALVGVLADVPGSVVRDRFTVRSWTGRTASGERSVGVDQTNESVIVGDAAVVKWATHLQDGPHPAPRRISMLRDAGFAGMPAPWGLVTWQQPDGAETLVASVDAYLPGAVDGWTWAVELIAAAARDGVPGPVVEATSDVGAVVADLHAALSATAVVASRRDAARWRDDAMETLETACALAPCASVRHARAHRGRLAEILGELGELAGTPIIEGHGDLHVGQILRSSGRFVVTDFDGNPVLRAAQRMLPIPATLDVAGMVQSLAHAAIVARRYTPLGTDALHDADRAARESFLNGYLHRITELGHADLYQAGALEALRAQQVLREMIYAARHLPRWMYVPDGALPELLNEGGQR